MRTKRVSMNMMVFLDHLMVCPVCVCIIYALSKNYPSEKVLHKIP